MMADGQMMEGDLEQEMQLYDEHGNPQKFYDQDGNEIPFEEVKQFLMAQQAQQMAMQEQAAMQEQYGQEME